jgi:cyclopropane-fatty-acyl-phospholipid synthase
MIYEFKSRATGTVVMTKSAAEWILGVIGKQPGPTGIVTVAQMPAAVEALRRAVELEKQAVRDARRDSAHEAPGERNARIDRDDNSAATVTHAQRAWPFIEMLGEAHKAGRDVTWGV